MVIIERPWGSEEIIAQTPTYMGKILRRKAGTKGDFQSHLKHESHYLLEGHLRVTVQDDNGHRHVRDLKPGAKWRVLSGMPHQEEALTDCVEIEIAEPLLGDRHVIEPSPDAGLPSTTPEERARMARQLVTAYISRAMELAQVYGGQ